MPPKDIIKKKPAAKNPRKSKSGTIDLVVEHELHGVTPAMIDWWWKNFINPEYYKMWHPEDHVSIEWEVPPTPKGNIGAIHIATERIGEFPAMKLRLRAMDPASSPIKITYSHFRVGSNIGPDNEPLWWIVHEYEEAPYGTRMRSTFRLPADTPKKFIDALRQHNIGEMGQFPRFLPGLYKKTVG